MSKTRFSMNVIVLGLIERDGKILLMQRANTGWLDGHYDLVAGHVDGNETLTEALCREAKEEVGIEIDKSTVSFAHLLHYIDKVEYMYTFFSVKNWRNDATIQEPNKCDDLRWFDLNKLPDNIAPATKLALSRLVSGERFTEYK